MLDTLIFRLYSARLLNPAGEVMLRQLNLQSEQALVDYLTMGADDVARIELVNMLGNAPYVSERFDNEEMLKALASLVTNENQELRLAAIKALGQLHAHQYLPILLQTIVTSNSDTVKLFAMDAISKWRERGADAIPVLISVSSDLNLSIQLRETAIEALGATNAAVAIPAIVPHLLDPSPGIRFSAIVALHNLRDPSAITHLEQLLLDEAVIYDTTIGKEAAIAIAYIKRQS